MKKLALGIATAVLLATAAVPAMAQVGFYAGPGGVGVDVGAPAPYYSEITAATMAAAAATTTTMAARAAGGMVTDGMVTAISTVTAS